MDEMLNKIQAEQKRKFDEQKKRQLERETNLPLKRIYPKFHKGEICYYDWGYPIWTLNMGHLEKIKITGIFREDGDCIVENRKENWGLPILYKHDSISDPCHKGFYCDESGVVKETEAD